MKVNKITLNSQVQFDFFHLQKNEPSNSNIFVSRYIPSLANNSISLITFDDTFTNIYDIMIIKKNILKSVVNMQ